MSKHSTPFRPKNVQYANFEMFGATQNTRLPAITSAQKIQDSSIRDLFRQLSKKTSARIDAFNQLKLKIPQIQTKEDFLTVAEPCYAVFESSVSDYTPETRILSIEMISIILDIVIAKYKDQLSKVAKEVFPSLLLLFFDTEKSVLEKAKELLFKHFPEKEKRNAMISKLRDEISARLKMLFNELEDAKWDQLDESQYNENWGRLASMGLTLSSNLLITCKLSNDVFTSTNPPPILKWMQTKNNRFPQRTSPAMRAAAYVYISVIVQAGFLELHGAKEISSFILAESSPLAQEKLFRLIIALLEKQKIKPNEIQQPILDSLYLFYQPQKVGLEKILDRIKDKEFIEKCITKASQSTDINTANELFECIFASGRDLIPNEFLLDLFQKSIATNPDDNRSNNFFNQCSLQFFTKIKDEPAAIDVLSKADEMRAAEFLSYCDSTRIESWLKSKQAIRPETLVTIIRKAGTKPIRNVWPNIKDIPLEKAKSINSLVSFIKIFEVKPDEIGFIIANMPECLSQLLRSWDNDFTPFKTNELFNKAGELLDNDLMLIPILKKIFPDEPSLNQLIDETIRNHLKKENLKLDSSIFEYFTPSNELLDDIIFSEAINALKPKDTLLIPLLTNRINELIPSSDPEELAEIAAGYVKSTQIDPISITASPLNHPIFCFTYWDIIGFDMMNQPDFCNMLECYLHKVCPFLPAYLYTQNKEWQDDSNVFPDELYEYIENHKELAYVAFEMKLLLTLASICFINDLDFSSFEAIDSLILLALPNLMPPSKDITTLEDSDGNNDKKLVVIEDDTLKTIRCEWNMDVPVFPNENDLRGAVCYLQHNLPVVESFDLFKKMATTYIGSNDTLEFFLSLRLLSMIYYANQPFDVQDVAFKILEQVDRFSPLPNFIINEISIAFQIARFLTPEQFNPFIFNTLQFLEKNKTSETVSKIIVPLISYFNAWEIVDGRFNGKMNLSNIEYWHFVTTALKEMPYKRRIDTIPVFTDSLPSILSSLDIESKEFMMLITTFPSTAMKWSTKLPNSKAQPLYRYMEKTGSFEVFKQMAATASKMKLDSTTITTDYQNKSIKAVYLEDASSVPVVLNISFPKVYPFRRIDVSCEFGDEGENCAYKVFAAIDGHQSIEAGVIAWHQFVTYRLREVEPCTICYSYLSEEMKKPTIACPTCGQKFHGKCIQKWFSQCLKPTCPYCGSPWDEKKRDKSKK